MYYEGLGEVPGNPQVEQITYMDLMARMDQNFLSLAVVGGFLVLLYAIYNIFLRDNPKAQEWKHHIAGGFDFMVLTVGLFWTVLGLMYY